MLTFYGDCKHLIRTNEPNVCKCLRKNKEITSCSHCKTFMTVLIHANDELCATCRYSANVPAGKERLGKYVCVHAIYPSKTRPHYTNGLKSCRLYNPKN